MTGSLSSTTRPTHSDISRRTNENYQVHFKTPFSSNNFFDLFQCRSNCCVDDYYSHQTHPSSSPHHQYECIPEYLLTIKHQSSLPYATFSRSYIRSTDHPKNYNPVYFKEESSSLIPSDESQSGWTRRNSSSNEQRQKPNLFQ